MVAALFNMIWAGLDLASPYFLKEIMQYIEDDTGTYPRYKALIFVGCIFLSQFLSKILYENIRFYQLTLGWRASQSLAALVYCKTLKISSATNKKYK